MPSMETLAQKSKLHWFRPLYNVLSGKRAYCELYSIDEGGGQSREGFENACSSHDPLIALTKQKARSIN